MWSSTTLKLYSTLALIEERESTERLQVCKGLKETVADGDLLLDLLKDKDFRNAVKLVSKVT